MEREYMERKQCSLTAVLALVAGLVGGVVSSQFFIGFPVFAEKKANAQKIVEAEEFRLVDAHGKVLGGLRVTPSGEAELALFSAGGANGVVLTLEDEGGTWLFMLDKNGKKRARFGLALSEFPTIELFDRGGRKRRAVFAISASDKPYLAFFDKGEEILWASPPHQSRR